MAATYQRRFIKARNPWLWKSMPPRHQQIAGVMLHCTRAGIPGNDDGPGTENWDNDPRNNQGGWGSFQDFLIYRNSGLQVQCTNYRAEYASWTAGGGAPGSGTWMAGIPYLQIEMSQSVESDPFPFALLDSTAQLVAEMSNEFDFPIQRIDYLTQKGTPPRGICTHDRSANGTVYGKSDPGYMFPWSEFISMANAYKYGEVEEVANAVPMDLFEQLLVRLAAGSERGKDMDWAERVRIAYAWLADDVEQQSTHDLAASAMVVALQQSGVINQGMPIEEVMSKIKEEIEKARIVIP